MRHRKGFNQLSRKSAHRKAMFANMASSLILHKRIQTTTAKAKALRSYVEPLITKSKNDSTHSRRVVFSYLKDKNAVTELFREISPKIADRPGGYTRILKTGNRLGDNADMCIIELVDYNENLLAATSETKTKTSRRRRGGKKKTSESTAVEATTEVLDAEVEQVETTTEETEAEVEEVKSEKTEAAEEKPEESPKEPEEVNSEEIPEAKAQDDEEKTEEKKEKKEESEDPKE